MEEFKDRHIADGRLDDCIQNNNTGSECVCSADGRSPVRKNLQTCLALITTDDGAMRFFLSGRSSPRQKPRDHRLECGTHNVALRRHSRDIYRLSTDSRLIFKFLLKTLFSSASKSCSVSSTHDVSSPNISPHTFRHKRICFNRHLVPMPIHHIEKKQIIKYFKSEHSCHQKVFSIFGGLFLRFRYFGRFGL